MTPEDNEAMRIFVTGATGFIGSAIVRELAGAGYRVLGLARSDAAAQSLAAAGAEAHRGELADPETLRDGARKADAVIHTAFIHDFSRFAENCETDRRAIEALGAALAGSERPLIVTSGTALLAPGRLATEEDAPLSSIPRVASEEAAVLAAERGARVSVVRLPPSVHGAGDHGFVPALIGIARAKGVSAYVGDGNNRWPAVHRTDAARLYRLVLEKGVAGNRYHCVAEGGIPFRELALAIASGLEIPVAGYSPEQASGHFGWMAHVASIDNPASSRRTRELLGWQPAQPTLIDDLGPAGYFGA
jgi:nucleoside-diphosphate-sugar epimerase